MMLKLQGEKYAGLLQDIHMDLNTMMVTKSCSAYLEWNVVQQPVILHKARTKCKGSSL